MKTDRELLELAAKAAGKNLSEYEWYETPSNLDEFGFIIYAGDATHIWNPLRDDGDALRLAVKLGIDIDVWLGDMRTIIIFGGVRNPKSVNENHGSDPYAATRRAIVRAAAAIGEGMK